MSTVTMSCADPAAIPTGVKDRLAELPSSVRLQFEQELAQCIAQQEPVYANALAAQAEAAAAPSLPLPPEKLADGSPNPAYFPALLKQANILGGAYNCPPLYPEATCYLSRNEQNLSLAARIFNAHRELRPELYVSPQHRGPAALHQAAQERQAARKGLFTSMGIAALLGFFLARR